MQEKIDWYQEVVDLEPSSKLFFPLAKMLAEQDVPRAVETLQRGLERHPEFIEARFFYVELLHKHQDQHDYAQRLEAQLTTLSPMLSRYAGFWQAWGKSLLAAHGDKPQEKALAASFLGAMCAQEGLTLADIFAAGLQCLSEEGKKTATVSPEEKVVPGAAEEDSDADAILAQAEALVLQSPDQVQEEDTQAKQPEQSEQVAPAPKASGVTVSVSGKVPVPVKVSSMPRVVISQQSPPEPYVTSKNEMNAQDAQLAPENSGDDTVSLRTRSMAEVLAEQGDYNAALDIYADLLQSTEDVAEKQDLENRIAQVQALSTGGASAFPVADGAESASGTEGKASSPGNERVISVLGALADRLDARLHS